MVTINSSMLKACTNKVIKAAKGNDKDSRFLRIRTSGDGVVLSASNKILGIISRVDAVEVSEKFDVAVNADLFAAVINKSDGNVDIGIKDNKDMVISFMGSKTNLPTLSSTMVTDRIIKDPVNTVEIKLAGISEISHCVTNNSDFKMSSFFVRFSENGYHATGLDGKRISIRYTSDEPYLFDAMISGDEMKNAISIIGDQLVSVSVKNRQCIQFSTSDDIITVSCHDGDYYNISNILSMSNNADFFVVDRNTMIEKLEIVELFDNTVILEIEGNELSLSAKAQKGNSSSKIEIDNKSNNSIRMGVNVKYLLDALKSLSEKNVTINYIEPKSPLFIRDEKNDNLEVILPINIA